MIDDLKRRLADAEAALSTALVSGADTLAARAARDDAVRELAAAKEAHEAADAAAAEQEAKAIAARADEISRNAIALLQRAHAQFSTPAHPAGLSIGE